MKVSIIIGTMNHLDDLLRPCLDSIRKHTDLQNTEVIVVANGCTDKTKEYVDDLGEPFKLLWFDKPLGFPRTNNEGIAIAKGEYILLLNNDTIILDNSWIDKLLEPFNSPQVGLTAPVKFAFDCRGTTKEALAFWCTMIKREVFEKIGYLDEIFNPFGCEDIDFSIRAVNAGYRLVQVPHDVSHQFLKEPPVRGFPIYHLGSATTDGLVDDKKALENRNMQIIYDRYGGQSIKLNLGCGADLREGYINSDLYNEHANVKFDSLCLPYANDSADEIMAYHIIEHFSYGNIQKALREWCRVLKPGGRLHLETPDFLASCKEFISRDEAGRRLMHGHFFSEAGDTPGQLHYFLFTEFHLGWMLERMGFRNMKRLEPDSSYVTRKQDPVDKKIMLNVEAFK
jgi:glycosyltransferase involved in cell wall biosynthesis